MKQSILLFLLIFSSSLCGGLSGSKPQIVNGPTFLQGSGEWAANVFESMTLEQRIGQLFMVAAYSNKNEAHVAGLEELVRDYHIGGLIFFQGGPVRQAIICNRLQSAAQTPMLIGMDAEWGLSMRLDSTPGFPRQMTLGAIHDDQLIYEMGKEIARQFKRLGMHINFAPVADVNNNPANPVINSRSFGELRENVARKSAAYMRGMQENGVLANAKHFPGHGDTDTDSHHALPVVNHSLARLDSLEFYPFRELFNRGLASTMVAHMFIPALDSTEKQASTLSRAIVHDLLREEMGFEGLIITDALNMKGVSAQFEPGTVELKALLAGNDILLFAEDVPKAVNLIKAAIESGEISEEEINSHCMRILRAKEWVGLNNYRPIALEGLTEDLNHNRSEVLNKKLIRASMTLASNTNEILPLSGNDSSKTFALAIGGNEHGAYRRRLEDAGVNEFEVLPSNPDKYTIDRVLSKAAGFDRVIVSIHGTNQRPSKNFGLSNESIALVNLMRRNTKVLLVHFGNPYALLKLQSVNSIDAVLVGYQDTEPTHLAAVDILFGKATASGVMPVSIGDKFKAGQNASPPFAIFPSASVSEVGLDGDVLGRIDSIAMSGISEMAYPGCQVLVARRGNLVYHKSFGYHTYENVQPVTNDDIYDLASLTKILSSTAALMHLQDAGLFELDKTLGDYLPEIEEESPYHKLPLRKVLAHTAGLLPWIPFYQKTLQNGELRPDIYHSEQTDEYPVRVADGVFMKKLHSDSLFKRILATRLRSDSEMKSSEYAYSDLGYYFVLKIVERLSGMPLDEYVDKHFYQPMGLATLGYKPRERFPLDRIAPTEYDRTFRKRLVHGDVHDPGAAMLGGVGGHAGLFSNAHDVAVMMQMFINGGLWGGKRYLSEEVLQEYTRCQFCLDENDKNRRGAGFDKPVMDNTPGPTCHCVTFDTFGHTGFTGTIAWADPEQELVYVFLSNRVYPTAENKKLAKMNIRTEIQQTIYDAIID